MNFIYDSFFLKHKSKNPHPECPQRLNYFEENSEKQNISEDDSALKLLYSKKYIQNIQQHAEQEQSLDQDTYTNKHSYKIATKAVNAAIKASETNNFSLARPPGHHANQNKAMGFCLFNNIAIATQKLVNQNKKILIIDIDGHHGNGTQDIFYNTDQVLFLSTHQFPAYPGTGWVEEIGEGKGKGYTMNIPLQQDTGDDLFIESLKKYIPIVKDQFKPDVVAVSAGFDGHHSDPLLQLNLTTNAYFQAGKLLYKNFNNIFACLEGGYNLESLHECILDFTNGINNKKQQFPEQETSSETDVINDYKMRTSILDDVLKAYW